MQTESISITSLVFDPANARKHDDKNLDAIKGSLARFGQQKPIVIGKNNVVIAGNGTLAAAKALGWDKINIVRTELAGPEATAFALADNRTAELASWDDEILGKTLQALQEDGFPIADIGFDPGDFFDEKNDGLTDPDEIPDVPQNVRGVERGQIWQLGDHRMMCGDSTSKDDVERLMSGEKADMVFTDPPYGMNLDTDYGSSMKSFAKMKRSTRDYRPVEGDDKPFDPSFLLSFFNDVSEMFLWGADYYCERISEKNNGSWIVWDKRPTETMDKMYGSAFELCWSKTKHKRDLARVTWAGCFGHNKNDDGGSKEHPTQKPVKLAEWFFGRWGKPNDLVADLFLGSGSTLIACEKTNRKCFGMEIDPHYCSVIIERFEKFTGKKAELLK